MSGLLVLYNALYVYVYVCNCRICILSYITVL